MAPVMDSNEMQEDIDDSIKEVQPESSPKQEPKKRKPKSEIWEDVDPDTGFVGSFWDNFHCLRRRRGPVDAKERKKALAYSVHYRWNHEKNCLSFKKIKNPKKDRVKIYNPASLQKKLDKKKKEREEIVDKVFQLLPSINGIKTTDGYKVVIPKTLDQLTNEAVDMKMHLETRMNVKGSEFLLKSVEYVIYMVALFSSEIVLPTFDWNTRRYPEQHLEIPLMKIEKTCKLAERRLKLSKSGLVLPGFDSRGIAQVNSVNGNKTDKAYACVPSSSDPNRKLPQPSDLSLDGKEKKIWLEFKEFDKWNLEGVTRSIQLDHPIVSFIGDFAVAAFNKACEMFVKKDEHNNLHDIEYMACRYLKFPKAYHFYMIIEAIEEGNLGVYETEVVCSSDGNVRTLTKFLLTDMEPVGTRAMAVSLFSSLRSLCKTVEGVAAEKESELSKVMSVIKGYRGRGLPMYKLSCISQLCTKIVEGFHRLLFLDHSSLFSPDCSRTTNPDAWSHPDNNFFGVMVRRTKGNPCRGYDYDNPYFHGRGPLTHLVWPEYGAASKQSSPMQEKKLYLCG